MLESKIEKAVTDYAKTLGYLSYKLTSPSNRAVPDRMYIGNCRVIFVEYKQLGKKPTALQAKTHRTMREHGATVYVIDSIAAGRELFDEIT